MRLVEVVDDQAGWMAPYWDRMWKNKKKTTANLRFRESSSSSSSGSVVVIHIPVYYIVAVPAYIVYLYTQHV